MLDRIFAVQKISHHLPVATNRINTESSFPCISVSSPAGGLADVPADQQKGAETGVTRC